MKQLIALAVFCIFLMIGCTKTPQQKAEKVVDVYLKEHLKDPDSYQNIELGEIKELTWIGLFLQEDLKKVKANELSSDGWGERAKEFRNKMTTQGHNPDSIIAYTIKHKYRAKNSFGGYTQNNVEYYFDTKVDSIFDVKEIE